MLNLYPEYVARNYMLFMAVAVLGTMQAAATCAGLRGLQIGGRLWPRWLAWTVLSLTWAGAAAWFIVVSPDFISPGLAGSELIAMFAAGAFVALVISLMGGSLCRGLGHWQAVAGQAELPGGCTYSLVMPSDRPLGLVVLAADPDLPPEDSKPVADAVLRNGFACVRLSWSRSGPVYPDALAILPSTLLALGEGHPWAQPLVVVGLGLGGDLALRAAHDDKRVALACAVGPALAPSGLLDGLLLLREMSFLSAWAWRRRWDRRGWLRGLRSAEALAALEERAAVLVSACDGLTESRLADGSAALIGRVRAVSASHRELVATRGPAFVRECLEGLREDVVAGA